MTETAIEGLARLCGMPPRVTEAFVLIASAGGDVEAVARAMSIQAGTVRSYLSTARELMWAARLSETRPEVVAADQAIAAAHVLDSDRELALVILECVPPGRARLVTVEDVMRMIRRSRSYATRPRWP